ncbi:cupin domain-containing protein [Paeniglutamicibacter sp. ABSL32-1]|uniref:cupin domain-containing protein n=1 Tax=Paeniglutamicibacter quisquiliarum TaxID=2849498 RepID=UPI001C2D8B11|nr:cupin domain-containing protein [Paeniglutamicibacter quisquiliarum]MBV1781284.1 cupin domain-containing protein [Paeniglutamicibacter quisquiliarum]
MTEQIQRQTSRLSVVRQSERENLWFLGDLIQPIISSEMTDGRFMMALTHSKLASEPPLHEHVGEDEIFYILEGTVTFWAAEADGLTLGPGDCILMPKDVPHTFQASPDIEAKWLVMSAPGGLEKFFRAVAIPADYAGPQRGWEMDEETEQRLQNACDDFNITLLAEPGVATGTGA